MATESEWKCPICHDDEEDVAYLSPCLHQFCLGCAVRWAQQMPSCATCRSVATDIVFSVWSDDDYLTFDVPRPAELSAEDLPEAVPGAQADAFPPEVWVDFFKSHPNNIRPLMPWLRRQLEALYEDRWWDVAAAEGTIVAHLCLCGLDEAVLERQLQNCLPELMGTFIRHLTMAAVRLCGRALCQHLAQQEPQAAEEEEDQEEEEEESRAGSSPDASTSRGGTPGPQEAFPSGPAGSQPQEDAGEAAAAGSRAQGGSCRPSAPGRGREGSRARPRRPPKRRAPEPQEAPQPRKRPPRRRR